MRVSCFFRRIFLVHKLHSTSRVKHKCMYIFMWSSPMFISSQPKLKRIQNVIEILKYSTIRYYTLVCFGALCFMCKSKKAFLTVHYHPKHVLFLKHWTMENVCKPRPTHSSVVLKFLPADGQTERQKLQNKRIFKHFLYERDKNRTITTSWKIYWFLAFQLLSVSFHFVKTGERNEVKNTAQCLCVYNKQCWFFF